MRETVTTAKAAEIVAIGYEGLRSYLKRGLLGSSGLMPPFVGGDAPAPDLSRARAEWKRFGFVDLCLMRLAKQMIDIGLSFDQANAVVSNSALRKVFAYEHNITGATLIAWPPFYDFIVFVGDDLQSLPKRLAEVGDIAIVLQLDRTATYVRSRLGFTN